MLDQVPYGIVYPTSRIFQGEVIKRYIGRHKWRKGQSDDGYLGSGKLLARAILKYGRKSFIRETLEICYSHDDLNRAEAHWVTKFNAIEDPSFYNLAEGGMNTKNLNGIQVHQYDLEGNYLSSFESSAEAGRVLNLNRKNILKAAPKKNITVGGYQWRFYKVDKISDASGTCNKEVFCYSLDGIFLRKFSKIKEAADWLGATNGSNITACCRGIRPLASNLQWRYVYTDSLPPYVGKIHNRERSVTQSRLILPE